MIPGWHQRRDGDGGQGRGIAAGEFPLHGGCDAAADLHQIIRTEGRIPEDWHAVARDAAEPGKTRVTIRLDSDIVRFFKAQGPNWQPRLNRVLRAWMHARLAGLIRGAETMDYLKRREGEFDGAKPSWGAHHATLAEGLGEESARRVLDRYQERLHKVATYGGWTVFLEDQVRPNAARVQLISFKIKE